jgi:hypothetical protein
MLVASIEMTSAATIVTTTAPHAESLDPGLHKPPECGAGVVEADNDDHDDGDGRNRAEGRVLHQAGHQRNEQDREEAAEHHADDSAEATNQAGAVPVYEIGDQYDDQDDVEQDRSEHPLSWGMGADGQLGWSGTTKLLLTTLEHPGRRAMCAR